MGIILWIVFGAIVGWIANILMKNGDEGILMDIIIGIIGASLGGFLMNILGNSGVTGFNVYSLFVAVIGAMVLIWISRILRRSA